MFKLQIRLNTDHLNATTQLKVAFDNIKASTKNLLSKFVKRQFKSRLISPSSKYTTIYVSNLVTNALSIYNSKAVIINLCYKCYTNLSIKYIETLKKIVRCFRKYKAIQSLFYNGQLYSFYDFTR